MSDLAARVAGLSPAQRKLLEQRLKSRSSQPPAAEPIAIIGMACRFPGAPDLRCLLAIDPRGPQCRPARCRPIAGTPTSSYDADGRDAGQDVGPLGRVHRRARSVRSAVLRHHAARSGADGPAAAAAAGSGLGGDGERRPAGRGTGRQPTGVFVGIGGTDYSKVCVPYDDYYQQIDAHMGTGNALSIAANRLSYVFDFHGPSAAVDTACSSSSLAIHFAVESLRRGESDAALAGGVNMILTPETTIAFSKARMLSPEGVCRPFDARANGYVRGEGCGLVLLKRLADAERDGDNILAVLRATSVNQDGRTSGISAPNSQSQMACIRAALKQAGLTPDDIDYIEAHGTGTPLGDPIEMLALAQIFRRGRWRGAALLRHRA